MNKFTRLQLAPQLRLACSSVATRVQPGVSSPGILRLACAQQCSLKRRIHSSPIQSAHRLPSTLFRTSTKPQLTPPSRTFASSSVHPLQQQQPQEGDVVEDDEFLFFWHPPAWPGQWTEVTFVVDGETYSCAEQYMMAQKARLFGDEEIFTKILQTKNPREHKKLGRMVKKFDPQVWDKNCLEIVVQGNLAKFSQHPAFAKRLLATKNKTLVEASPYDTVWGVGMTSSHPDIRTPSKWLGKNLLGIALMKVRETIRSQAATV